jgi:hypothetical protein
MPTDPRKRQKKLERKAAGRKAKRQQLMRVSSAGLIDQLRSAALYPVLHSYVTDDVWKEGLGWVILSRELPYGGVAFAIFLLDRYCLGVKNVVIGVEGRFSYETRVSKLRSQFHATEVAPAYTRKLVEGAVAYAESFGLHPHPDYPRAKLIFGDIDPAECHETFEYGKDGKPFFIAGPHDTPRRCQQILNTLAASTGGPENFHFLTPIIPGRGIDEELLALDDANANELE